MKLGRFGWVMLTALPLFLTGCGDFWQSPNNGSGSFTLTNSDSITVATAGNSGTSTITVTPTISSYTGTVTLTCSISSTPSGATCSFSPTSLTFSSDTAQTSTLTAATTSSTPPGAYTITVYGTDASNNSAQTTACLLVATTATSCSTSGSGSGNFYILDGGSAPGIVGKSIASGTPSTISGSPWLLTTGLVPTSLAIDPNGNYLVVGTESGVLSYPITNGTLGTATQLSPDDAFAVQVDPSGKWVVEAVAINGGVALSAIPVNTSTGASSGTASTVNISISSLSNVPNNQMAISGDGSYVFVALGKGGTLYVPFSSSAPFPSGVAHAVIGLVSSSSGAALSVAVDPGTSPRLLYVGESVASGSTGGLLAYNYSSLAGGLTGGSVSQAGGSPSASGGASPVSILPISTGDYVYVGDDTGIIGGFAVTSSGTTYKIASTGSTATVGNGVVGLAEDSTDTYLLSASAVGSPYFDVFTFDTSTPGKLDTTSDASTTQANSVAIVAAP